MVALTPDSRETGLPAAVITCSDSAAAGTAADTSGPLAAELLAGLGHSVAPVAVVPDEVGRIRAAIRAAIDAGARIVVTTGGTGAGPRDVTPEALHSMGLRELPGLGEAMRAAARVRVPAADLSRGMGGIVGSTLVLALPGSPGGVRDGLAAVGGLLGHAAGMAAGGGHAGHRHAAQRHEPPPGLATSSSSYGASTHHESTNSGEGVSDRPISEAEVTAEVASTHAGAVVTFVGVVRDHDHDREVIALHYEGHPDAGGVLATVLEEARQRPGVLRAAARHRVGQLVVGDVAFVAAVSAAHRAEAFAACAWLVDEAKARLPIWKHQHFADGTDEWVNCA